MNTNELFLNKTIKILNNESNWYLEDLKFEKLKCSICQEPIKHPNLPNHFVLNSYNINNEKIQICFHFKCAFKPQYLVPIYKYTLYDNPDIYPNLFEIESEFLELTGMYSLPNDFKYKYDFLTNQIY